MTTPVKEAIKRLQKAWEQIKKAEEESKGS
jgi:flagellin-specific chaperone FliS